MDDPICRRFPGNSEYFFPGQEVGAWTPTLTAVPTPGTPVYSAQFGRYLRQGALVFVQFRIVITDLGGATSQLAIGNLPFAHTLKSGAENREIMHLSFYAGFTALPVDTTGIYGFFQDTGNFVRLYRMSPSGGSSTGAVLDTHVAGIVTMYGTMTYMVE